MDEGKSFMTCMFNDVKWRSTVSCNSCIMSPRSYGLLSQKLVGMSILVRRQKSQVTKKYFSN